MKYHFIAKCQKYHLQQLLIRYFTWGWPGRGRKERVTTLRSTVEALRKAGTSTYCWWNNKEKPFLRNTTGKPHQNYRLTQSLAPLLNLYHLFIL